MSNDLKRKAAYIFGTILVVVGVLVGIGIVFAALIVLLTDGIAGATRIYPDGISGTKFMLSILPFAIGGIAFLMLGMNIRDNNTNIE